MRFEVVLLFLLTVTMPRITRQKTNKRKAEYRIERANRKECRRIEAANPKQCTPPPLCETVKRKSTAEKCLEFLTRTKVSERVNSDGILESYHQACVCVMCDRIIIGCDKIKWMKKSTLINNKTSLSVQCHHNITGKRLSDDLVNQYQLPDESLKDILLSPRAHSRCHGKEYMACESCYNWTRRNKYDRKKPSFVEPSLP